jgi:glycosyltransferase involved in cell wall biosynthesis
VDWTAKRNAMRDVRVVHVINSLERGGAESNLARLCAATSRCGVANAVVTLKKGGALCDAVARDARVVPLSSFADAMRLMRGSSDEPPDLVVGWMYIGCVVASTLTPRSTPVIWSIRHVPSELAQESAATRMSLALLRRYCGSSSRRRPRLVITNSAAARDSHQALGLTGDYRVIGNGVDVDRFSPNRALGLAVRREIGVAETEVMLLQVGRYHPHKGQQLLLDAAVELLRRRRSVRLVMVGNGVESIRHRIFDDSELSGRVRRLPGRDDLVPIYRAADLLINPSFTESFPTAVIEAMSCAVPCIVTDTGDSREIVGDTGEVVEPGSIEALQRGIERFLARSAEDRQRLGAAARARVLDRYTMPQMSAAFVDAYRSVARQARS